jgi:hypothetical protein
MTEPSVPAKALEKAGFARRKIALREIISEASREDRDRMLVAAMAALAFAFLGARPKELDVDLVTFELTLQSALPLGLALTLAYFLLLFGIGARLGWTSATLELDEQRRAYTRAFINVARNAVGAIRLRSEHDSRQGDLATQQILLDWKMSHVQQDLEKDFGQDWQRDANPQRLAELDALQRARDSAGESLASLPLRPQGPEMPRLEKEFRSSFRQQLYMFVLLPLAIGVGAEVALVVKMVHDVLHPTVSAPEHVAGTPPQSFHRAHDVGSTSVKPSTN